MTTEIGQPPGIGWLPTEIRQVLAVAVLLTCAIAGAYVVSGTRRYAIERLHGLSAAQAARNDFSVFVRLWASSGAVVLAVSTGFAVLHNGGRWQVGIAGVGQFIAHALLLQAVLVAAAIVSYLVVLGMVTSVDTLSALKGEAPAWALTGLVYGLRFAAVAVGLSTLTLTLTLLGDTAARDRSLSAFDQLGGKAALALGNVYTPRDEDRLVNVVGPWLRSLDRNSDLVLAGQRSMSGFDTYGKDVTALTVNDAFLAEQPVRLASGDVLRGADPERVLVLVPQSRWSGRASLLKELGLSVLLKPGAKVEIGPRPESGQRFFTYTPAATPATGAGATGLDLANTFVTDPVMVVLPSRQGWPTNSTYTSLATQGGALLTESGGLQLAIRQKPELRRYLLAATPVTDKAATVLVEQSARLRLSSLAALVATAVVTMTGFAAALVLTRRMTQRAFIRHLFGWSMTSIYRVVLSVETLLLVALAGWIPFQVAEQRRDLEAWQARGIPPPSAPPTISIEQWASIGLLSLVTAGGFLVALKLAHQRVVREGTSAA
ncbi:MAG: hypothetical protein ACRCYU_07060 [Nocardioides sp.]